MFSLHDMNCDPTFVFFFHSSAVIALLPLLAKGMPGGGAGIFTTLLASMGLGAIVAAVNLRHIRPRFTRDGLVLRGAVLHALSMAGMSLADSLWVAIPAMFVGGMAWITTANTLSVSIQLGLPDWVRARGMSIYQMALMGGSALGAAVWGQVATWTTVPQSLGIAAALGTVAMGAVSHLRPDPGAAGDLTPRRFMPKLPRVDATGHGHVMVMIEYCVDLAQAANFRQLMLGVRRRSRLLNSALSWELLNEIDIPDSFL